MIFKMNYFTLVFLTFFSTSLFSAEPTTKKCSPQLEVTFDHTQKGATKEDSTLFLQFFSPEEEKELDYLFPGSTFENGGAMCVRAFIKKELVGISIFQYIKEEKALKLHYICIKNGFQGNGIGQKMIEELATTYAINCATKKIYLVSITSATPFYEQLGFTADEENVYMEKYFN